MPCAVILCPSQSLTIQEAVEKYQQSKRELDEVVAQMESLVSDASLELSNIICAREVIKGMREN